MSLDFTQFDTRNYPTVSAREGYREWVATYEQTVQDEMDLRLLSRLASVPWATSDRAVDLGCGTGRTSSWIKQKGVARIDGIDISAEMIEVAKSKGIHDTLVVGDVLATGFQSGAYDLATACLVDEHIRDLTGLYRESSRLVRAGGLFIIVGYHAQFIMASGMPTHFHRPTGEPIAIETHVHLFSDHFKAACQAGLSLIEMEEGLIDDTWVEKKPKWRAFLGHPISFALVWRISDRD